MWGLLEEHSWINDEMRPGCIFIFAIGRRFFFHPLFCFLEFACLSSPVYCVGPFAQYHLFGDTCFEQDVLRVRMGGGEREREGEGERVGEKVES